MADYGHLAELVLPQLPPKLHGVVSIEELVSDIPRILVVRGSPVFPVFKSFGDLFKQEERLLDLLGLWMGFVVVVVRGVIARLEFLDMKFLEIFHFVRKADMACI